MTSKEKELVAGLFAALVVFSWHFRGAFRDYAGGLWEQPGALVAASRELLWAIAIAIVVHIVAVIVLYIGEAIVRNGEVDDAPMDERDQMITLRGDGWFNWIAAFGFFAGLGVIAYGLPGALGLNLIAFGWFASTVVSALAQIYMLRRGF